MIATTLALIAMVLPAAQAPWKASKCSGRERISVVSRATMIATTPSTLGAARIADPDCEVMVREGLTAWQLCTVLTHEFGHLAGMAHSSNPRSVMYPSPMVPRRCWAFALR